MKLSRITVPIDFSPDSETAFAWALELARALGASVDLIHVVENPLAAGVWSSAMYTAEVQGLQINLVRDATRRLRDFVPKVDSVPCRLRRHVRVGDPAREIVNFAGEKGASLIVMGTLGRTGLSHLMIGSVAEHVSRSAPCPLLTVKSNQAYAALQQRRKTTKVPA
jgi:nucleotide-binding universal stress UspA family protein